MRISTEKGVDEVVGRFASPATELSSLFRQSGSSRKNSATPVIQRTAARLSLAKIIFTITKRKHK